jgi:hypothetical protein
MKRRTLTADNMSKNSNSNTLNRQSRVVRSVGKDEEWLDRANAKAKHAEKR